MPSPSQSDYSFILLGDTHYDADPPSTYHADYDEKEEWLSRVQRAEFDRNAKLWAGPGLRLLQSAGALVRPDTRFVLQMGDLIQGDCNNPEVHKKMLSGAFDFMKQAFGTLPFLSVMGNHDFRGRGALEAYREYMPGRLARELGEPVRDIACFSFVRGGDLYVFADFTHVPVASILAELEAHRDVRYTFLATHGQAIPSDMDAFSWILFGSDAAQRARLRAALLQRDAIVLAGHSHNLELSEIRTSAGRVTQFVSNCIWTDNTPAPEPKVLCDGPAEYGKRQAEKGNAEAVRYLGECRDAIVRYWFADGAGASLVRVRDDGVSVEFHGGDSPTATKTFQLR